MPAPAPLPPTCSIKGLVCFGPGLHKGELYTPARCDTVPANFAATGGKPVPLAKIGHDKQQRYAQSLGFPNVGVVTRCDPVGGGCFEVDIDNVPTEVGGKVNAGFLRGSSVELKSQQPDPRDPARKLPGDVLTGISLLGEEQPAVQNWPEHLRAKAVPRATFADGTEVPPDYTMDRWLNLANEVSENIAAEAGGEFSADRKTVRIKGRQYATDTLCFSDFSPDAGTIMTPEEIKAKLAAAGVPLTPEQAAALGGTAAAAEPPKPAPVPAVPPTNPTMSDPPKPGALNFADLCKKYASDEKATPEQKMMAAMFSELEENKKRVGELQAAADADQKKDAAAQMAAFSDMVERDVEGEKQPDGSFKGGLGKKLTPVARAELKKTLVQAFGPQNKSFSTETDRLKAYRDEIAGKQQLPDDPRLAKPPGPAAKPTPAAAAAGNPVLAAMTGKGTVLDRVSPAMTKQYREGAPATA